MAPAEGSVTHGIGTTGSPDWCDPLPSIDFRLELPDTADSGKGVPDFWKPIEDWKLD